VGLEPLKLCCVVCVCARCDFFIYYLFIILFFDGISAGILSCLVGDPTHFQCISQLMGGDGDGSKIETLLWYKDF